MPASPATGSAVADHAPEPDLRADHLDLAVIAGVLSRDPVVTELPSGTRLHRYEVTVRDRSPADSVPVAWFDPQRPPALAAGDAVVVVGRVRRRFYRSGGATRSATEIEAERVARRSTVARALARLDAARAVLVGDG